MKAAKLIQAWNGAWNRIIFAQVAPTVLLITTVALLQFGLDKAGFAVRVATVLILLASGILGAVAEFTAADEAMAIAKALRSAKRGGAAAGSISRLAKWLPIVKFVTPAIFVAIFVYLVDALFFSF